MSAQSADRLELLRPKRATAALLVALGLAASLASSLPAQAACDDNTPVNGQTVTCVAPDDPTGIGGNADNVTVNMLTGSSITRAAAGRGIDLDADAIIDMQVGSSITTAASEGMELGLRAMVTMGGSMNTANDAIEVGNDSVVLVLSTGSIVAANVSSNDAQAIDADNNAMITTQFGSTIMTTGGGISLGTTGTAIIALNDAMVDLGGSIVTVGKASGVQLGNDATLILQQGASIELTNFVNNVAGTQGAIVAANGANITIAGSVLTHNNTADGMRVGGTNSSVAAPINVTITGTGSIHTEGLNAEGIFINRPDAPGAMPPPFVANITVEAGGIVMADQAVAITEDILQVLQAETLTSLTVAGTVETGVVGGNAINLFIGDDRLELHGTFSIVGDALGGTGMDTFVLGGPGVGTFDASLLDGDGTDEGEQFLGFETFIKEDASAWTLTGMNDETFAWTVTGGSVFVTGILPGSSFDLSPGVDPVLFGGTGTLGSFDANDGTTVAPGTVPIEIATLTLTGGFTFEPGSLFDIDLDGTPVADLIAGTGVGTINGGGLNVTAQPGSYGAGERFTVIDVDTLAGGVFDEPVVDNLFLYDFVAVYDAGIGLVELEVVQDFVGSADTPNQMGAAEGLEDLDPDDPSLDDLRTLLSMVQSDEEAQALFDQLSGEIYATNLMLAANTGELFNRVLRNRGRVLGGSAIAQDAAADGNLSQRQLVEAAFADSDDPLTLLAQAGGAMAEDGTIRPWLGLYGEWNSIDGDGNAADVDQWIGGVAVGVETTWSSESFGGSVGLAAGYSHSSGEVDDRSSDVDADAWSIGLYGNLHSGAFGLAAAISYTHVGSDVSRDLPAPLGTAEGDVDSNVVVASLEGSYAFLVDRNVAVSPLAGIDALWVSQDDFDESGGGGGGLTGESNSYNTYTTALGGRVNGQWDLGAEWMGAWEIEVKWRHRFGDDVPNADLAFIGAVSGAGTFRVFGPETSDDWAEVGVGATLYSGMVDVGVRYDGALGSDIQSHALGLTVGVSF